MDNINFKIHKYCQHCGVEEVKGIAAVMGMCKACFQDKYGSAGKPQDDAPSYKF